MRKVICFYVVLFASSYKFQLLIDMGKATLLMRGCSVLASFRESSF